MKRKRLCLIVNPISGTSSKEALLPKIESKLIDRGFDVDILLTSAKGDATRFAREAVAGGVDAVAACGGDGTVNETARALCGSGVPLAIIPSGSGNGLARHISIPIDEMAAIDFIDFDNVRMCDFGVVNGKEFFCAFGVGFDAAVAKRFAQEQTRGAATYIKNAFLEFSQYQPKSFRVTVDGVSSFECKAYLIACCNASQYGNNAFIAPDASITDGLFDVVILKDASHIQTLLAGIDMLTGMLPHNRQIQLFKAKSVDIVPVDQAPAHVDGEPFPEQPAYCIENMHAGLQIFVNPAKRKFTPFLTPIESVTRDISVAIQRFFES